MKVFPSKPLRLPRLRTYVPGPDDPRIYWFNSEREDVVQEVVRRVMERHAQDDENTEYVLNDTAYQEIRRLETDKSEAARRKLDHYRNLVRRLARMSSEGKHETLRDIAYRFAADVAGNFDPRVYRLASRMIPGLLTAAMHPASLVQTLINSDPGRMDGLVSVEGPIEKLHRLARIGTLVWVPTHSSNLDSMALGWALFRSDLPPAVYGAGKNLFTNPIVSFFMHNLGAYRVDRRVRASLYKDVLKAYSSVMIERGYHSLFFPGGTRSRSGNIETRLKLGLAGTGVEAFARNQVRGVDRPVFFVPGTINYALVLEAETLAADHFKESGKARYIIEDDEFSRIDRWLSFFNKLRGLESACVIRFGDPIDPFCNPVDERGRSIAPSGKLVDASTYVSTNGTPIVDHARDAAYTRDLGTTLVDQYIRETVVMSTQLVGHIMFRRMVRATPGLDLFSRLRHRGDIAVPHEELVREIGEARDALVGLERNDKVHVSSALRRESPDRTLDRALTAWNGYHSRPVARVSNGAIIAEDPNLLVYYGNRVRLYAQDIAREPDRAAAREIAVMELRT